MIRQSCALRALLALLATAWPTIASSQSYRLRLDTRVQNVTYRGITPDSVPASDTVSGPTGGPVTTTGFAVTCFPGGAYCNFYRPGRIVHSAPLTTTADMSMWGFGVPGLSVRATARLVDDLEGDADWPGTDKPVHLLEAYALYEAERYAARLGRQSLESRFGFAGFDGARVTLRDGDRGVDVTGYVGWGLARAVALPVTSAALDPLDEFRPQDRQLLAGGSAGWSVARVGLRASYQREVDPGTEHFVSERAGLDFVSNPYGSFHVTGGADYDLAAGWWGSAESMLSFIRSDGRFDATLGVRRYRPHFDLWTIWGAFSPVPYRAALGSFSVAALPRLRVRARAEKYEFENAEAETPLVEYESAGWRFSWGATFTPLRSWIMDAGYHAEHGPGAASRGLEGAISFSPADSLQVSLYASSLSRPLEFRFSHASLRTYGGGVQYNVTSRLRFHLDANVHDEQRDRPDVAAFDWNQVRLSARITLLLGNDADFSTLPPAVRRMPGGRERP